LFIFLFISACQAAGSNEHSAVGEDQKFYRFVKNPVEIHQLLFLEKVVSRASILLMKR